MYVARRIGSGLGKPGPDFFELLHLIAGRMRQPFLVVEHRAEIAHIKPTAASFAFVKMLGLAQWRPARLLAHDRPARDRRHARNLGHFLASFGLIGISIFEPRGAHSTVHKTPRSASSASSRSSRAFSTSGSARANRRYRMERASLMTAPAAA